jgi:hypothetical protein
MSSIVIQGDTSGSITVEAPSVAGTHTLTLPKATGTIATNATVGLGTKNLIINGDMRIAQRGTSVAGLTGSGYHVMDRFRTNIISAGTWTITQDTDVPSGQGFSNSIKLDCTTANASLSSNELLHVLQRIEAQNLQHLKFGTSNAESLTASFWVKSNKTGTYTLTFIQPDASNKMLAKSYTINSANTWEKKTITIEGDIAGQIDNNNDVGLNVYWQLAVGPSRNSGGINTSWTAYNISNEADSSQVNLADSTSNYINITGVQLEVGDTATPFEHRPYDMELLRCQRYFFRDGYGLNGASAGVTGPIGLWYTSSDLYAPYYFPVEMRAAPTVSSPAVTGGYRWHKGASYSDVNNFGTSFTSINRKSMYTRNGQVSGGTAGQAAWAIFRLAGTYVELNAEL